MFTATRLQAVTYLLGVCLFSISFLVFLNSSVSFVITDLIRQEQGVGNAVGTLGFADELVALVVCPTWGVLSDRIGVRTVSLTWPSEVVKFSHESQRFVCWAMPSSVWLCFFLYRPEMYSLSCFLPDFSLALEARLLQLWSRQSSLR